MHLVTIVAIVNAGITLGVLELTGKVPRLLPPWPTLGRRHGDTGDKEHAAAGEAAEADDGGGGAGAATAHLITTVLTGGPPPADTLPGLPAGTPAAALGAALGLPTAPSPEQPLELLD
jgi:hypothetical protein